MISAMGENPGNVFWPQALSNRVQSQNNASKGDALAKLYAPSGGSGSMGAVFTQTGNMHFPSRSGQILNIKI